MTEDNTQDTSVPSQSEPQTQPQQTYQPAPSPYPTQAQPPRVLMELTGGMKFGWLLIGILMGISGILISWLANVGNVDKVKSDAIKFTVIGFVINIVFWLILCFFFGAMVASLVGMNAYRY